MGAHEHVEEPFVFGVESETGGCRESGELLREGETSHLQSNVSRAPVEEIIQSQSSMRILHVHYNFMLKYMT